MKNNPTKPSLHRKPRNNSKMKIPVVEVHPISIRELNKGHPWITLDSFSQDFPKSTEFIKAESKGEYIVMVNDPSHPKIKARFWSRIDKHQSFHFALNERIQKALLRRDDLLTLTERNNFYLSFGEADYLPGLFIQYLDGRILIQSHMEFWNKQKKNLVKILEDYLPKSEKGHQFFWQNRYGINRKIMPIKRRELRPFYIEEFGVKYKVDFSLGDDIGIYCDMSAIRVKLEHLIRNKDSILNLYSHTGAFSLYSMSLGVQDVHSVDVSAKYLDILDNNLKQNQQLNPEFHQRNHSDTKMALKSYIINGKQFDTIICDPPSFSRGKGSYQKSLNDYQKLIPMMNQVLKNDGHLICFINTHQINWQKFKTKFNQFLAENRNLVLVDYLKMNQDCMRLSGFPEGDYLKGIILKKRSNSKSKSIHKTL